MKKKQLITLIVMLVVVVGLAAGYILMKDYNTDKEEKEAAEEEAESAGIPVYDINKEDVVKISLKNESASIDMVKKDDAWVQDGTDIPMKAESVDEMLTAVGSVKASKIILENADNMDEYKLDEPLVSYTITVADGTEYKVRIGGVVTSSQGYYALLDSDTKVYDISETYYLPFDVTFNEMIAVVDEVNIKADYITHFEVSTKDNLEFEADYFGDDTDENGYYTWNVLKPYSNINADTDSLKAVLAKYEAVSLDKYAEYNAEDYSKYGLDDPYATISLDYYTVTGADDATEGTAEDAAAAESGATATAVPEADREYKSVTIYVGDYYTYFEEGKEREQEAYYVRLDGSNNVYSVQADTVKGLIDFDAFSLADHCIYPVTVDHITSYDIEFDGEKHTVERKEEPGKEGDPDKDGDGTISTYYVDGKKVDEEEILTLYSAAYLLTLSGEADKEKVQDDAEAVLTITYHPNEGDDVVVNFIPYDNSNFYQMDKNGLDYFLTDKRGIDDLISRYKEFLASQK